MTNNKQDTTSISDELDEKIQWLKEYLTGTYQGIANYDEHVFKVAILDLIERERVEARISEAGQIYSNVENVLGDKDCTDSMKNHLYYRLDELKKGKS